MEVTTVGVDLAKDVFQVALANRAGRVIGHRRLTRRQFERFFDALPTGTAVVMESCGTAHYWGRRGQAAGLHVRLLPVQYVRPFVRRNKTDRMDAEAILEANRCGEIRPVPVKTSEQQALLALHRIRTQWQTARVARINTMRALLREHGHAIPVGARTVLGRVTAILEDADAEVPGLLRQVLALVVDEVRALEVKIDGVDRQLAQLADAHPVARRLQTIPGVGVLTATALVGAVGHIHAFRRGREFASSLGLTPRETSSGGRRYFSRLANEAMCTCDVSWRTVRDPSCGWRCKRHSATPAGSRGCNNGRPPPRPIAADPRRRSRSPISSPASCGRCGLARNVSRAATAAHGGLRRFLTGRNAQEEITHGMTGRTSAETSR